MTEQQRQIAALGAVVALISSDNDIAKAEYVPVIPPTLPHPYAANARQLIMQYRDITQRRIIKRYR